jgi:hypothetical protein
VFCHFTGLAGGQILIPFTGLQNPLGAQANRPVFRQSGILGAMPVLWGNVGNIGKLGVSFRRDGWDLIDCLQTEVVPKHIPSRRAKVRLSF